jgi:hypothetical protein
MERDSDLDLENGVVGGEGHYRGAAARVWHLTPKNAKQLLGSHCRLSPDAGLDRYRQRCEVWHTPDPCLTW